MATLEIIAKELVSLSETVEENDRRLEEIHGELLQQKDKRLCCLEAKNSSLLDATAKTRDEMGWKEWQAIKLVNEIEALQDRIQKDNHEICELEVLKLKINHEKQKGVLEQKYIGYQHRIELLEECVPIYTIKMEEQIKITRASFKELHGLHNTRNRVLLQRLRHATEQYAELCDQIEENMNEKTHKLEI